MTRLDTYSPQRLRGLLLAFLLIANLLFAGLAGLSLIRSKQQYEDRARVETQNLANAIGHNVSNSVEKLDLVLRSVVEELEHQLASTGKIDEKRINALIDQHLQRMSEMEAIRIADANGLVFLGKGVKKQAKVSWADREYFTYLRDHPKGGLQISKPRVGRVAQKSIVGLARRYNRPDGSFAGVISAPMAVSHFSELLAHYQVSKHTTLILRDAGMGLITRHPPLPDKPVGQIGNSSVSPELQEIFKSGVAETIYYTPTSADGYQRIVTFRRLTQPPFILIVGVASVDYLADWQKEIRNTAYFVLGFLLLSIISALLMFHLLNRLLRDIEERKEYEAQLLEAKLAAEAANLAKSRFLATMSHEIRTPLNGVLGMAQLMMMPKLTEEERLEYTRTILNSGQTLLALLNDILDLSKIDAGKLDLAVATFDPRQLLEETATLFSEAAHRKGLMLEATWEGGPEHRQSDPIRLRQMLSNYLSNAIKFTERGSLRIIGRPRPDDPDMIEFAVADTGIGIDSADRAKLFQPFSQVDTSDSRRFGGTGLGLSIVRSLARQMGGDVGVDSVPGQGSTFRFHVQAPRVAPGSEHRAAQRILPEVAASAESARRILVVEDNRTNQIVITAALGKSGYQFSVAENGAEALAAVTGDVRPDLILMDCQMPVMNGFEATERIRAWEHAHQQRPLPIVALTAGAFEEDRQRCLDAGMSDYLAKPLDVAKLRATLAHWLPSAGDRPPVAPAETA